MKLVVMEASHFAIVIMGGPTQRLEECPNQVPDGQYKTETTQVDSIIEDQYQRYTSSMEIL